MPWPACRTNLSPDFTMVPVKDWLFAMAEVSATGRSVGLSPGYRVESFCCSVSVYRSGCCGFCCACSDTPIPINVATDAMDRKWLNRWFMKSPEGGMCCFGIRDAHTLPNCGMALDEKCGKRPGNESKRVSSFAVEMTWTGL